MPLFRQQIVIAAAGRFDVRQQVQCRFAGGIAVDVAGVAPGRIFTALTGKDGIFIVKRVGLKGHRHGEKRRVSREVVDEQLVQALAVGNARFAQREGAVAHIPGGSQGRIQLFADL